MIDESQCEHSLACCSTRACVRAVYGVQCTVCSVPCAVYRVYVCILYEDASFLSVAAPFHPDGCLPASLQPWLT